MQELVVKTTCDIDEQDRAEKVPAREVVWVVDGAPVVIDICDPHRLELRLSQMDDIARSYGRPLDERHELMTGADQAPAKRKRRRDKRNLRTAGLELTRDGRVRCPWPDCRRDYKNRGSLSGHFKHDHHEMLTMWEAEQRGDKPTHFCSCGGEFPSKKSLMGHVNATLEGVHNAVEARQRQATG